MPENGECVSIETFECGTNIRDVVTKKVSECDAVGDDIPQALINIGDVIKKYKLWCKELPMVKPYYAVKVIDDAVIVEQLAKLGCGFDCASQAEIQQVLATDVDPGRIIYANTIKQRSMLKFAAEKGVSLMTFDNEQELVKISKLSPEARLLLRISPPKSFAAKYSLSKKFGCMHSDTKILLQKAKTLGLTVVGVCFHVGSGCEDVEAHAITIAHARKVFDTGNDVGFDMRILDIGGGFPGDEDPKVFLEMSSRIKAALSKYFPPEEGVTVIAEPGRYFVESVLTLCVQVIGKRISKGDNNGAVHRHYEYYINEGVYGYLGAVNFFADDVVMETLKNSPTKFNSTVWGPTCDELDLVKPEVELPELEIGDWIYIQNGGAYWSGNITNFNGMPTARNNYFQIEESPEVRA